MSLGVNLENFRGFALVRQITGENSAIIRAEETGSLASRSVQLSVADNDTAFLPFLRSQDAKAANTRTRDIFLRLVAEEFGGEKNIPQSVRDVLTNFGGAASKPLTARRVVAVCNAVMEAKSRVAGPVAAQPAAAQPAATAGEFSAEAFSSAAKSAASPGFMSFSLFSSSKVRVFTIDNGKVAHCLEGNAPDPETCARIRRGFVESIVKEIESKAKMPRRAVDTVRTSLEEALLGDNVVNTPLKVDDPMVKRGLDVLEELRLGIEFDDTVSKDVMTRGTLKLNTKLLLDVIVAPALNRVLADSKIAIFSKATATVDDDGCLALTLDHAKLHGESSVLSKLEDFAGDNFLLKSLASLMKSVLAKQEFKDITFKVKPEYDAKAGALNLVVKVPSSTEDSKILSSMSTLRAQIADKAGEKIGTSRKLPFSAAPLGADEKKDPTILMKVAVNLQHFGTNQLKGLGLNPSVAGNIGDVKLTKDGLVVRFGDNPRVDGAQEPGKISGDVSMGANDIALNVTTAAVSHTIEKMLRGKMDFTSMSLVTAAGRNGAPGTARLSIRGLDLPGFAARKGGFKFWVLRRLGLMDRTDVDIDIRPSIDPVSKRIRLDVTGLSGTGSVGGVRGSLARKLLSKLLPLALGDIGGVGFVSGDDILSVTVDAGRLLGKVVPDHGKMIPGGIPAISEVSADENGFNVAVNLGGRAALVDD